MRVELISYTPQPEKVIAIAGRTSSSSLSIAEIAQKLNNDQISKLLRHLIDSGHHSTLEHASFTFGIEGISRIASHQLVRHRLASYTQQSQRYVNLKNKGDNFVIPPKIAANSDFLKKYREHIKISNQLYKAMVDSGISIEDARFVLPQAMDTQLVMTMNFRELMHASSLRLCLRAQWEIVQLFELIKTEVEKVSPFLGSELKAKCYRLGHCDEKESCGLFPTQ